MGDNPGVIPQPTTYLGTPGYTDPLHCDFCSKQQRIMRVFPTGMYSVPGSSLLLKAGNVGACDECAQLVQAGPDLSKLRALAIERNPDWAPMAGQVEKMHAMLCALIVRVKAPAARPAQPQPAGLSAAFS